MSAYRQSISMEITRQGHIGIDARHVEAYMRLEHSTLDGLSRKQFNYEIGIAIECIKADGKNNAGRLAKSFGL